VLVEDHRCQGQDHRHLGELRLPSGVAGRRQQADLADYYGAMREIVERDTGGAPCLFLHGASGDIRPLRSYEKRTPPSPTRMVASWLMRRCPP